MVGLQSLDWLRRIGHKDGGAVCAGTKASPSIQLGCPFNGGPNARLLLCVRMFGFIYEGEEDQRLDQPGSSTSLGPWHLITTRTVSLLEGKESSPFKSQKSECDLVTKLNIPKIKPTAHSILIQCFYYYIYIYIALDLKPAFRSAVVKALIHKKLSRSKWSGSRTTIPCTFLQQLNLELEEGTWYDPLGWVGFPFL